MAKPARLHPSPGLLHAATAHAECAGVLWQYDGATTSTTIAAWPQQEESARQRVERYGLAKPPPPGVGTLVKAKQGDFFVRFDCLPDIVDPRGPKRNGPRERAEARRSEHEAGLDLGRARAPRDQAGVMLFAALYAFFQEHRRCG